MECINCSGSGCDECEKKGTIEITCCPLELVTNDVWEILEFAELYEKGLPPIAGGSLDQAKSFIYACRFIFK
ncbi:MAG TPA: hypothetical protein ENH34_01410, partial [Phycisphaerales bacterium]|nr:hypothetical protein [Phycisphaerales bacterium]